MAYRRSLGVLCLPKLICSGHRVAWGEEEGKEGYRVSVSGRIEGVETGGSLLLIRSSKWWG
jgi:hypothetical protein